MGKVTSANSGAAYTENILSDSLVSLFFRFALPAVLAMVMVGLYQFVDAIFVGQFVGPEGMGAVSLVYPVALINMGVSGFIGLGSSTFLSRSIGRKDKEGTGKVFSNLLFLNIIVNMIIFVPVWFAARPLLILFGGEGQVLDYGMVYIRILLLGMFAANFGVSLNLLIRAEGRMKAAMLILSLGAAVNLILDPLFIIVFRMNVFGAGIATVIGQICTALASLLYMKKAQTVVPVSFSWKSLDGKIIKEILTVGFSGLVLPLFTIIEIAVQFYLIRIYAGMDELLVFGVVMRLLILYVPPIWGVAQGMQPIVAMNSGAGRRDRVKAAFRVFTLGGTIVAVLLWLPVILAPRMVLGWFITVPSITLAGREAPRIFLFLLPFYGILFSTIGYYQALKRAAAASILVSCRMLIFYVPLQFLFTALLGADGLWFCNPAADMLSLFLVAGMAVYYGRRERTAAGRRDAS